MICLLHKSLLIAVLVGSRVGHGSPTAPQLTRHSSQHLPKGRSEAPACLAENRRAGTQKPGFGREYSVKTDRHAQKPGFFGLTRG